jgi:YbbR domain-containing protein
MNRFLHPLHELFVTNLGLKIISLVLAFSLWFLITTEKTTTRRLRLPVEYENFPKNMLILKEKDMSVTVRISGPASVIGRLGINEVGLSLDLTNIQRGVNTLPISLKDIELPRYAENVVTIQEIIPNRLVIEFDEIKKQYVKVEPVLTGLSELAPGFVIGECLANPPTVLLQGPAKLMERISRVATESISVSGMSQSFDQKVQLISDDPFVLFPESSEATVSVNILPAEKSRSRK